MGGLRVWPAAAAVALTLAGCGGGGGGGVPPITSAGASVRQPGADLLAGQVVQIRGADGPSSIYVEEGAFRFLGERTSGGSGTTQVFRSRDGQAQAFLTRPTGFDSLGLLRLVYTDAGMAQVSDGVFGRFTAVADMPTAGQALYAGTDASIRYIRPGDFVGFLNFGQTSVTVDFAAGRAAATLDFAGNAGAPSAPVDRVELTDMQISGNRLSGGALAGLKNSAPVPEFSTATPASEGIFGGPGAAEVGGVFYATMPGGQVLEGRYLGRR